MGSGVIRNARYTEFVAFVISGGIAALVNFGSRIVLNQWMSYSTSIILAYFIGMATAYLLFRLFVFERGSRTVRSSVTIFCLVNLLAVGQTWLISVLLAFHLLPWLGVVDYAKEAAHAVGVAVPVITSYFGHKYFSFR